MGSMQWGACDGDRAAGTVQRGSCSGEHAAVIMQRGLCSGERAVGSMRWGACSGNRAVGSVQWGSCSRDRAVGIVQRGACSTWLSRALPASRTHATATSVWVRAHGRWRCLAAPLPPSNTCAELVGSWLALDSASVSLGQVRMKQARLCSPAAQEPMLRPSAGSRLGGKRGWGCAMGDTPGPRHCEPGLGRCRSQPGRVEGRESKPVGIKMTSPALWRELRKISPNK